eukprot:gene2275-1417_t
MSVGLGFWFFFIFLFFFSRLRNMNYSDSSSRGLKENKGQQEITSTDHDTETNGRARIKSGSCSAYIYIYIFNILIFYVYFTHKKNTYVCCYGHPVPLLSNSSSDPASGQQIVEKREKQINDTQEEEEAGQAATIDNQMHYSMDTHRSQLLAHSLSLPLSSVFILLAAEGETAFTRHGGRVIKYGLAAELIANNNNNKKDKEKGAKRSRESIPSRSALIRLLLRLLSCLRMYLYLYR